jgi:hypothetical protein
MSTLRQTVSRWLAPLRRQLGRTPVLSFMLAFLLAVLLEQQVGEDFAKSLEFRKIPKFFGLVDIFEPFSDLDFSGILAPFFPSPSMDVETPIQDSGAALGELVSTFWNALFYQGARNPGFFSVLVRVLVYDIVIFIVPILILALLLRGPTLWVLQRLPRWLALALHLGVLYVVLMLWGADGGTRELILIYMGINIMLSASLNLVNGYMGEFSVGHAGFMAVGAYVSSVLTMVFFRTQCVRPGVGFARSGSAVGFIIALLAGGVASRAGRAAGRLPVLPHARRLLAFVTLAVNFIVQGVINNMEVVGGPRGLNGVPLWTNLTWIFLFTVLSIAAIYNLVNSTLGKGIIAIREDEIASS